MKVNRLLDNQIVRIKGRRKNEKIVPSKQTNRMRGGHHHHDYFVIVDQIKTELFLVACSLNEFSQQAMLSSHHNSIINSSVQLMFVLILFILSQQRKRDQIFVGGGIISLYQYN